MAQYNHINYMREVAEKSKDIGHTSNAIHFHRVSGLMALEEFLDNISQMPAGFHLLVEEDLTGGFSGADNPLDHENYMFFLVKSIDINDHDAREKVKRDCKDLVKKIIGRMRSHWYTANKGLSDDYGLRNLDTDNIFYQTIGPIGIDSYGIEVRFSIIEKAGIIYNANDWTD